MLKQSISILVMMTAFTTSLLYAQPEQKQELSDKITEEQPSSTAAFPYTKATISTIFWDLFTYGMAVSFDQPWAKEVTKDSIRTNFHSSFEYDSDVYITNYLGHPYQGSLSHGGARSLGLSFYESIAFDMLGSYIWEIVLETNPPSSNDFITTSFMGAVLGETLFQISQGIISNKSLPRWLAESLGFVVSPANGMVRLVSGESFSAMPSPNSRKKNSSEFALGASLYSDSQTQITSYYNGIYGNALDGINLQPFEYFTFFMKFGVDPSLFTGTFPGQKNNFNSDLYLPDQGIFLDILARGLLLQVELESRDGYTYGGGIGMNYQFEHSSLTTSYSDLSLSLDYLYEKTVGQHHYLDGVIAFGYVPFASTGKLDDEIVVDIDPASPPFSYGYGYRNDIELRFSNEDRSLFTMAYRPIFFLPFRDSIHAEIVGDFQQWLQFLEFELTLPLTPTAGIALRSEGLFRDTLYFDRNIHQQENEWTYSLLFKLNN